jgi:broad specificity phosphatase PhoE
MHQLKLFDTAALPPLYILRHGQTEWNLQGRMQGQKNSSLTEKGLRQAAQQARIMAPVLQATPDMNCVTSPLTRARDTAAIALAGQHIVEDKRIMEVSAGSWEGRLRSEVIAELPAGNGHTADEGAMFQLFLSSPDGEPAAALEARCRDFLLGLTGPTAIVTHGVTAAFLRGLSCSLSWDEMTRLSPTQGCVFAICGGVEKKMTEMEKELL